MTSSSSTAANELEAKLQRRRALSEALASSPTSSASSPRVAKFDYAPGSPDELWFSAGDVIKVVGAFFVIVGVVGGGVVRWSSRLFGLADRVDFFWTGFKMLTA